MSNVFFKKNDKIFQEISLSGATPQKQYVITRCLLPNPTKLRLYEMGLTPNTILTVTKQAPLGDPIEIQIIGYTLCIRKKQAKYFVVKEIT